MTARSAYITFASCALIPVLGLYVLYWSQIRQHQGNLQSQLSSSARNVAHLMIDTRQCSRIWCEWKASYSPNDSAHQLSGSSTTMLNIHDFNITQMTLCHQTNRSVLTIRECDESELQRSHATMA